MQEVLADLSSKVKVGCWTHRIDEMIRLWKEQGDPFTHDEIMRLEDELISVTAIFTKGVGPFSREAQTLALSVYGHEVSPQFNQWDLRWKLPMLQVLIEHYVFVGTLPPLPWEFAMGKVSGTPAHPMPGLPLILENHAAARKVLLAHLPKEPTPVYMLNKEMAKHEKTLQGKDSS